MNYPPQSHPALCTRLKHPFKQVSNITTQIIEANKSQLLFPPLPNILIQMLYYFINFVTLWMIIRFWAQLNNKNQCFKKLKWAPKHFSFMSQGVSPKVL